MGVWRSTVAGIDNQAACPQGDSIIRALLFFTMVFSLQNVDSVENIMLRIQ